MKPSKLLRHKQPAVKTSLWCFSKEKKWTQRTEQLLKATISSNVSALRASFLVANHIAKAKKPFIMGEELILPATKDICCELLGEAAVQKVVCLPLLASIITIWIDEIAEDTEALIRED